MINLRAISGLRQMDFTGSSPIHRACAANNLDAVRRCLDRWDDVNERDERNNTPIHAALSGDVTHPVTSGSRHRVVSTLLDAGADVKAVTSEGSTPLHMACKVKDVNIVKILVEKGADLNLFDESDLTPLHVVSGREESNRRNAPMDSVDEEAKVVKEIADVLIEAGANINVVPESGSSVLHLACLSRKAALVQLLVDRGADVNVLDGHGETPLQKVFENPIKCKALSGTMPGTDWEMSKRAKNSNEILSILIQAGARVCTSHLADEHPLHVSCHLRNLFVVQHLIDKGEYVNKRDEDNRTPLHIVLNRHYSRCDRDMALALLKAGADVHAVDTEGCTTLHLACRRCDDVVVRLQIKKGAGVNIPDKRKAQPLHFVTNKGEFTFSFFTSEHRLMLTYLLEAGADVRPGDGHKNTPLHYACQWADGESVQMLISQGANVNAVNCRGEPPLHYLVEHQNKKENVPIAKLLIEAGASIEASDARGRTALMKICGRSDYNGHLVEYLMRTGANWRVLHASFQNVCEAGGADHIDRLCELGLLFPDVLFQFQENRPNYKVFASVEYIDLAIVLSRAGMDCSDRIPQPFYGFLPKVMSINECTAFTLVSCCKRYLQALDPYQVSLLELPNKMAVKGDFADDCSPPGSLKASCVHCIRRHLGDLRPHYSILPMVNELSGVLPPALLDELRLAEETDTLRLELRNCKHALEKKM